MKHIIESWNEKTYDSAILDLYFKDLRLGVLDIETTGLNPDRNRFILGCLFDVSEGKLHQVLAENSNEEETVLEEFMKLVDNVDVVVTYNGRHFDMPFLARRWQKYNKGPEIAVYDLDLYQVLNKHSQLRKLLPNLKQKTVEDYMGFWMSREDEISGAQSVELYKRYEATADPDLETRILLHNNDDVRQLTRLTKAVIKSDFHKAMFNLGFPVRCGEHLLEVRSIRQTRTGLKVSGRQLRDPVEYMGFEFNGEAVESRFHNGEFEFTVPVMLQEETDYRRINEFVSEYLKIFFNREILA